MAKNNNVHDIIESLNGPDLERYASVFKQELLSYFSDNRGEKSIIKAVIDELDRKSKLTTHSNFSAALETLRSLELDPGEDGIKLYRREEFNSQSFSRVELKIKDIKILAWQKFLENGAPESNNSGPSPLKPDRSFYEALVLDFFGHQGARRIIETVGNALIANKEQIAPSAFIKYMNFFERMMAGSKPESGSILAQSPGGQAMISLAKAVLAEAKVVVPISSRFSDSMGRLKEYASMEYPLRAFGRIESKIASMKIEKDPLSFYASLRDYFRDDAGALRIIKRVKQALEENDSSPDVFRKIEARIADLAPSEPKKDVYTKPGVLMELVNKAFSLLGIQIVKTPDSTPGPNQRPAEQRKFTIP